MLCFFFFFTTIRRGKEKNNSKRDLTFSDTVRGVELRKLGNSLNAAYPRRLDCSDIMEIQPERTEEAQEQVSRDQVVWIVMNDRLTCL